MQSKNILPNLLEKYQKRQRWSCAKSILRKPLRPTRSCVDHINIIRTNTEQSMEYNSIYCGWLFTLNVPYVSECIVLLKPYIQSKFYKNVRWILRFNGIAILSPTLFCYYRIEFRIKLI